MRRGFRRRLAVLPVFFGVVFGLVAPAAGARAQAQWQPEPETYGIGQTTNVPVTMADGTVLMVDVYSPTDPASGQPAQGPFPVLMVQTPYGKTGSHSSTVQGLAVGDQPYLIKRGYINVVADVRGTGASGGTWDFFEPVQQTDGATLVKWAAALPHSTGKVGLYGPSYMGIDQFLTVNELAKEMGANSPVKAMFPVIPANDVYRDAAMMGGIPDAEFDVVYLALVGALNEGNPLFENPTDLTGTLQNIAIHGSGLAKNQAQLALEFESGGPRAYDETYWNARQPRAMLDHVIAAGVPAFVVGGWFDLFQRGEPLNYSGLQNAYAGLPVGNPMSPTQAVSGRYQLLMGPWYHLTAGNGVDMHRLHLAWFDRWLKGIDTGIDQTNLPLHMNMLGTSNYIDAAHYPIDHLTPTTYYLNSGPSNSGAPAVIDGRLTSAPPAAASGSDPMVFTTASSPCGNQVEQWSAGASSLALSLANQPTNACTTDDRSLEIPGIAQTYTSDPYSEDKVIGGPIDATMFVTSTRPDTEIEATLEDVGPGGASKPLTSGAMAGSFRSLDAGQTWTAADGKPMLPYHPYTQASVQPMSAGLNRMDVEVFPTFAKIPAGDRLRLTLTSSDVPHLYPTAMPQLPNMTGGVYQVQRNAQAASFVEIPLGRPGDFPASTLQGLPGVGSGSPSASASSAPAASLPNTAGSAWIPMAIASGLLAILGLWGLGAGGITRHLH